MMWWLLAGRPIKVVTSIKSTIDRLRRIPTWERASRRLCTLYTRKQAAKVVVITRSSQHHRCKTIIARMVSPSRSMTTRSRSRVSETSTSRNLKLPHWRDATTKSPPCVLTSQTATVTTTRCMWTGIAKPTLSRKRSVTPSKASSSRKISELQACQLL